MHGHGRVLPRVTPAPAELEVALDRAQATAEERGAVATSTTPTDTAAPRSSSPSPAPCGTAGRTGRLRLPGRPRLGGARRGAPCPVPGPAVRRRAPTLPRSAQGHPVIFQAGGSGEGRDFAARNADVIFSAHGNDFDDALAFAEDIRRRRRRSAGSAAASSSTTPPSRPADPPRPARPTSRTRTPLRVRDVVAAAQFSGSSVRYAWRGAPSWTSDSCCPTSSKANAYAFPSAICAWILRA
jgi:hypothetical protein